jgi:hypothetical protein
VVSTVENAFAHGIDDFERLDHGTSWQIFDFQATTGHFIDAGDVLLGHFAENFIGTPRALHFEDNGCLGNGNHGRPHQWDSHSSGGCLSKEATAAGSWGRGLNVFFSRGHLFSYEAFG